MSSLVQQQKLLERTCPLSTIGRVTVDGIGMINASVPNKYGEFEFPHPIAAAEFLAMPGRLARLEEDVKEVLKYVKQERSSEDKSGELLAGNEDV